MPQDRIVTEDAVGLLSEVVGAHRRQRESDDSDHPPSGRGDNCERGGAETHYPYQEHDQHPSHLESVGAHCDTAAVSLH